MFDETQVQHIIELNLRPPPPNVVDDSLLFQGAHMTGVGSFVDHAFDLVVRALREECDLTLVTQVFGLPFTVSTFRSKSEGLDEACDLDRMASAVLSEIESMRQDFLPPPTVPGWQELSMVEATVAWSLGAEMIRAGEERRQAHLIITPKEHRDVPGAHQAAAEVVMAAVAVGYAASDPSLGAIVASLGSTLCTLKVTDVSMLFGAPGEA